jgi:chlorite dismutase
MQTFVAKYKIKENALDQVNKWADFLKINSDQVKESMQVEGVLFEIAFLDQQADGFYLIYVFKAENIQKVFQVLNDSERKIDIYHKEMFIKLFGKSMELEILIDFENPLLLNH